MIKVANTKWQDVSIKAGDEFHLNTQFRLDLLEFDPFAPKVLKQNIVFLPYKGSPSPLFIINIFWFIKQFNLANNRIKGIWWRRKKSHCFGLFGFKCSISNIDRSIWGFYVETQFSIHKYELKLMAKQGSI